MLLDLVGLLHQAVEDILCQGDKSRMGNPGTIVPVGSFSFLILSNQSEGFGISLLNTLCIK